MIGFPDNDAQFTEENVDGVDGGREGWSIHLASGFSFCVPKDSQITPEKGMTARFYGRGFGFPVRGLFLDGVMVFYESPEEHEVEREEQHKKYEEKSARRKLDPKNPDPQIPGFEWDDAMNEISGFGGGYEKTCRTMVSQGCRWWSKHPEADPVVKSFKNIYGIASTENKDAKSLEAAMMKGIDDCTGAMHQACLGHIIHGWHKLGSWEAYQNKMREIKP
jgi:hypothetical protein